ncbi:MAG: hypothetical protein H0W27_06210, partial [Actinobacteria bacterium]|nr:hypothetical protein [Actinomycetota bacterium]
VEETPPPRFAERVPEMGDAAVAVANACGYVNAGTVEFLVDEDGGFYFLEINARLQVEHTITEEVLGIDLVAAQLRISAGEDLGFGQRDIHPRGHAIECRINAEDPARGFLPAPGRLGRYSEPGGPGIRVDSGFGEGDEVPPAFDSLIAKLVTWGNDREEARRRMLRALDEFEIEGIPTTIPAHRLLLRDLRFVDGTYSTATVTSELLESLEPSDSSEDASGDRAVLLVNGTSARLWHPSIASSVSAATRGDGAGGLGSVVAPMHGTILKVLVSKGSTVRAGEPVAVLEAMKMETSLTSPAGGIVEEVPVETGSVVEAGEVVVRIA